MAEKQCAVGILKVYEDPMIVAKRFWLFDELGIIMAQTCQPLLSCHAASEWFMRISYEIEAMKSNIILSKCFNQSICSLESLFYFFKGQLANEKLRQ